MPKRIISTAALIAMAVIPAAAQEPLVFDEPVEIDNVSGVDQPDVAAGQNGRWIAVWRRVSSENEIELYAAQSADLGATWSEPRRVFRTTDRYIHTPRIVAGSEGHWAVVFQSAASERADGELLIAHSLDDSATWSEPVRFDYEMPAHLILHGRLDVTVNASGEWLATWVNRERGNLASFSYDEGRNWSSPSVLAPNADWWSVEVAATPAGGWLMAWSHEGIHLAVSSDGASWSELPPVTPEERTWFPFRNPTLSVDPDGLLLLSYQQQWIALPEVGEDIYRGYVRRSLDGGLTWTPASGVSSDFSYSDLRMLNLGQDDWLVLHSNLWLRSIDGSKWMIFEHPSDRFDRVAGDGFGNFVGIRKAIHGTGSIEAEYFGLPRARAAGLAAPGWPCPLAAVLLLAASPVILLAGRRGRVR